MSWAGEDLRRCEARVTAPQEVNFAGRVGQAAASRGLLVYPMQGSVDGYSGDHLLIAPPAVITAEQITWAGQQLRAAIEEATAAVL